jgi:hypothetical protein
VRWGRTWPRALEWPNSRVEGDLSVASFCRIRDVCPVVGHHDEALSRGVIAPDAEVVGVTEPVVRGIEEPLEHHRVRHAGEVPLRVPVRNGGWQLAGGAVVGLVVGGGGKVPGRRDVAARTAPRAATSVLADEAYAIAALRMPRGNCGSRTARSPTGAVAISPVVTSRCEATRAARRCSIRACRERWPERRRRCGVEGPAAFAWAGAGVSAAGVTGTGPGPVDRHG